jgi:hypothetical protein
MDCGHYWANCSIGFQPNNAPTTSDTADTLRILENGTSEVTKSMIERYATSLRHELINVMVAQVAGQKIKLIALDERDLVYCGGGRVI